MAQVNLGRIGFVNKGSWNIATNYKLNDVVKYGGSTYAAKRPNVGITPPTNGTDTDDWFYFINNSDYVDKTSNQDITGIKNFTASPKVPEPTGNNDAVNKVYVDDKTIINNFVDKPTPVDSDNFAIQEVGGDLKKVSFLNIQNVLQVVYAENKVYGSGSLTIPADGTIPQITEGNEILTCTITPKKANSRLLIEFTPSCQEAINTSDPLIVACFKNGTSDALYQNATNLSNVAITENSLTGRFIINNNSTNPTIFSLRAGVAVGGIKWNQITYADTALTIPTYTTMTITEIL